MESNWTIERISASEFISRRNELVQQGFEIKDIRFLGSDVEFKWNEPKSELELPMQASAESKPGWKTQIKDFFKW